MIARGTIFKTSKLWRDFYARWHQISSEQINWYKWTKLIEETEEFITIKRLKHSIYKKAALEIRTASGFEL